MSSVSVKVTGTCLPVPVCRGYLFAVGTCLPWVPVCRGYLFAVVPVCRCLPCLPFAAGTCLPRYLFAA